MSTNRSDIPLKLYRKFWQTDTRAKIQKILDPILIQPTWDRFLHPRLSQKVLTRQQIWDRAYTEGKLWMIEECDVIPPQVAGDYGPEFQRNPNAFDCSPRRVCELSNITLIGDRAIGQTARGEFIYESINNDPGLVKAILPGAFLESKLHSEESVHFDTAMSMIMHTHDPALYGHWMVEYLPRILALSEYEKRTNRSPKILIPENPPDWLVESLTLLGYSRERFVEWTFDIATVDRLVQPFTSTMRTDSRDETLFSPMEHRWLREKYLGVLQNTISNRNERYFISKQGLKHRYIDNFEQIEPILSKYEFSIIRPEELGFQESIEMFSRGKLFLGTTGSGLSNQLFARDANVIEIFPPNQYLMDEDGGFAMNCLLSGELGHDYMSLMGDRFVGDSPRGNERNSPYQINPEKIDDTLSQILT